MDNRYGLYVIVDHVAKDITQQVVVLHRHEAAAVRFFHDAALVPSSPIMRHPDDFSLVRLGYVNDDLTVEPRNETILEGRTWFAQQQAAEANRQ